MHTDITVIDNLEQLLSIPPELSKMTHLYLANRDIASVILDTEQLNTIIDLIAASKIKSFNLSNCNLLYTYELIFFLKAICNVVSLEQINLRYNKLTPEQNSQLETILLAIKPNLRIIATGCKTCPASFQVPLTGWQLDKEWSEAELIEILDVARFWFETKPQICKIDGFRSDKARKKQDRLKLEALQSNLPYSVLTIDGFDLLLPKFTKAPINIEEYNKSHLITSELPSHMKPKRVTLVFMRSQKQENKLSTKLLKIHTNQSKYFIEACNSEERNLEHANNFVLHLFRDYKVKDYIAKKSYLVTDVVSGKEGFDIMSEATQKYLAYKSTPISLSPENVSAYLLLSFSYMLAVMRLHALGLIHLDLKPENCIIDYQGGFPKVSIIDLDATVVAADPAQTEIKVGVDRGTPSYLAPEILYNRDTRYSYKQDYYACGLVLRQFLYPVHCYVIHNGKGYFMFLRDIRHPIYILTGKSADYYLQTHFKHGVCHNYCDVIASAIENLTVHDPQMRTSIFAAFFLFASKYSQLAQETLLKAHSELQNELSEILQLYPKAAIIVNLLLPNFIQNWPKFGESLVNLNALLNHILKLQILKKYLTLYQLCNNELPIKTLAAFQQAIQELYSRPDLDLSKHEGCYYSHIQLENCLKFHMKFKQTMLNIFSEFAVELSSKRSLPKTHDIIIILNNIQAIVRNSWRLGCSNQTILNFVQTQLNQFYLCLTTEDPIFQESKQKFSPILEEAQLFMDTPPISSPTAPPVPKIQVI